MNFKGYAELSTDLPDDIVETETEIVTFPGRNVAEVMAELMRAAGYDVRGPQYMDEHGWDLNVHVDGRRIWLELQGIDPGEFVLQVEAKVGFFRRLFGTDLAYYAEFLTKLNDALARDPRFDSVNWYELRDNRPRGDATKDPLKAMDWRG